MTHLEAMRAVRALRRVRVWSRTPERRAQFAEKAHKRFGVNVEVSESAEACVRGADLICTVTASREPVLSGPWISAGAHINAVGAALPTARELDSAAVARSLLYVDRRESALAGLLQLVHREEGMDVDAGVGELALVLGAAAVDDDHRVRDRRAPLAELLGGEDHLPAG